LALVKENDLKPENIAEVIIGVDAGGMHYCEPVSVRHYPRNAVDLQFSIPYNVANAIINRAVKFEHFEEKALQRKDVLEFLATKIKSWADPEVNFDDINKACTAARIQVRTKDGKVYVKRVDHPKGDPTNPMTFDDIVTKFWDCAELSAKPIDRENLKEVVDLIVRLEKVENVTSVIKLLT
jgi:2-methylcitrate dehydratase PrpD